MGFKDVQGIDQDYCLVCIHDATQLSPKIVRAPSGGSKFNLTQVKLFCSLNLAVQVNIYIYCI